MKNYRYFIMGMIVFMTVINYVDRGALSYAQQEMIKEFGFDAISWGAVLGFLVMAICLVLFRRFVS